MAVVKMASKTYVDKKIESVAEQIPNMSEETMSEYPTQAQLTEIVKKIFTAMGGEVR